MIKRELKFIDMKCKKGLKLTREENIHFNTFIRDFLLKDDWGDNDDNEWSTEDYEVRFKTTDGKITRPLKCKIKKPI